MQPLLKVSNIYKNYGGVQALSDVSFEIYPGERVSLVGENGSGKSTMIKIISGVEAPTSGTISINGVEKSRMTPKESMKAGIQVIYQDFSLYPNLTVEENLAYNYFLSKNSLFVSYRKMREVALKALDSIKIKLPLQKLAGSLTIAERQMVSIAKALLDDAKIIIMDEATTALTQKEVQNLQTMIQDLQKQGIALIFVSHKLEEIQAVAERCIFIRNGHKITEQPAKGLTRKDIVLYMSGLEYLDSRPYPIKSPNPILECRDISTKNLRNVSFSVKEGEIVGFAGLLGSGRSELALSLFGETPILSGDLHFQGKKITLSSIQDAMDEGIGYIPEDRLGEALFLDKSIGLNMGTTRYREITKAGGFVDDQKIHALVDDWLGRLKIKTDEARLPVSTLSGGNQQRVVLARWLMRDLKLLILNRPTVGVDVSAKQEINQIVTDLAKIGMSFIVISDDLPEFLHLCHRVYFVKQGRIDGCLEGEELTLQNLQQMLVKE
ncbi:MAG: sugar ABC transporter ATP-binding protein [Brevinema sp.]